MDVHVVSKLDNRQHATFQVPAPAEPLKPSSIRIRTALLGLTSNNLTYALGGSVLGWWDAYPLPTSAPAPYDGQAWGIVPAWGFAVVLESTLAGITTGETLFGLWPTSSHQVDLELTATDQPGHWIEVSPHRQNLASFYNRYTIFDTRGQGLDKFAWDAVVYPTWGAGYILSEYIFPANQETHPAIHPLGGESWAPEDADISKTVFISLAASTKTARGAAYNLFLRPAGSGPLGFLQVTSSPAPLAEAAQSSSAKFPTKVLAYSDIEQSAEWLASIEPKPERIIIADFGARDGALAPLVQTIQDHAGLQALKLTIIAIGNEQKVYTINEFMAMQVSFASLKVRMNTSGVQEAILRLKDPKAYFEELQARWSQWLEDRESVAADLSLVWGTGVTGPNGIEGGWDALCQGKVRPQEALVYRL
ncbi:hypothetical protein BJX63DRAFT_390071 [Aspergillus granulosus]|uniref:Uncharacterized protein n=1 Tax=Aspergillus granulosus TaxID=176169 RepID=A0ABR4HKP5_9EURO